MADDDTLSKTEDPLATPSSKSEEDGQKTIAVNVDVSGDHWLAVSYRDDRGELFHGVLLKTSSMNSTGAVGNQESFTSSAAVQNPESLARAKEHGWTSFCGMPQSVSLNGSRSPEWDSLLAINLRRTISNGAFRREDEFGGANSKPALGIRRLENRSVRLRPAATQRSTVLCAKCQEQRVFLPTGRRIITNGGVDRSRNGQVAIYSERASTHNSVAPSTTKRRPSDAFDLAAILPSANSQSGVKKFKARNGPSIDGDKSTWADRPSASDADGASKASSNSEPTPPAEKTLPKIPKLKISFGNNEEKTTTVIALPPGPLIKSEADGHDDDDVAKRSHGFGQHLGKTKSTMVSYSGGDTFDEREGAALPGGLRVGDIVWAKMQSSPYWPAKIFSASGNAACVTWCGSRQYGFVDFKAMEPFKESFHKRYNAKRNNSGYQKAVAEAIIKCSGDTEVDPVNGMESYYYRHIISAACWKYLTGSKKNSATQSRNADRNRRRHHGKHDASATGTSRRSRALKYGQRPQHLVDGIDSESVTSVSSMNSPHSTSTTPNADWQPTVVIRAADLELAEKGHKGLPIGSSWRKLVPSNAARKPTPQQPSRSTPKPEFHLGNGPVSPLPVEQTDDDDDDDDFKKLEIDETAQLDGDDDCADEGSSGTTAATSSDADPPLPARTPGPVGDGQGQPGGRPSVGESKDDFESALTELQEMNELCAGTSVLAQC